MNSAETQRISEEAETDIKSKALMTITEGLGHEVLIRVQECILEIHEAMFLSRI